MLAALALLLLQDTPGESLDSALKRFVEVLAKVQEHAADPIDKAQAIYGGALPGMLRRLDPHSVFFDPGNFEQLKELEKSTRKGFGTVVSLLPGRVFVLQALPGTPSARSGLTPGDEIVAINNIRLDLLEVEQLVQLLSEARQHQVRLDVRRPGNARILSLMLTPEDVEASTVDRAFHVEPGIGYVRVTSFDVQTGKQVKEAIDKLGGNDLKGLVLDLRNNPGGVLPAAVETASLFLSPGQKIVSVKGRSVGGDEATVSKDAQPYKFALAVLIDSKSASASEIVAGAVMDNKRGRTFGQQSFGKGLVQSVFPLSQGTGIALTTAYYYTPSGRSIQRPLQGALEVQTAAGAGGIVPDHVVYPEGMTRLRAVLDASGAIVTFATEYLQRTKTPVTDSFEISNAMMDDFQAAMSARNIRPGVSEWSRESEWLRARLKQEVFNQALGVAKGDEIEVRRDPVVLAALRSLSSSPLR